MTSKKKGKNTEELQNLISEIQQIPSQISPLAEIAPQEEMQADDEAKSIFPQYVKAEMQRWVENYETKIHDEERQIKDLELEDEDLEAKIQNTTNTVVIKHDEKLITHNKSRIKQLINQIKTMKEDFREDYEEEEDTIECEFTGNCGIGSN